MFSVSNLDELSLPEHEIAPLYVYVLKVLREDGEVFWYVGSTNNVQSRVKSHTYRTTSAAPVVRDGEQVFGDTSEMAFELVKVERVVAVQSDDRDRSKEVERRTAYEIAIEKNTTNVFGVNP